MKPRETTDQPTITTSAKQQEPASPAIQPDEVLNTTGQQTRARRGAKPVLVGVAAFVAVILAGAAQISLLELLDAALTRIERLDGPVNSVVRFDLDRARTAARAADDAVTAGDDLGPLCAALDRGGWLAPGALVYLESREPLESLDLPEGWSVLRRQKAGQVRYHLAAAGTAD